MLEHQVKGLGARFFAEIREQGDVAADERLQARADSAENRARAYGDPSHYTERPNNAIAIQFKLRGHHVVLNHSTRGSAVVCTHMSNSFPAAPLSRSSYSLAVMIEGELLLFQPRINHILRRRLVIP